MIEIPVDNNQPSQSLTINLDNKRFIIKAYWNSREDRWYVDLWLDKDTPLYTAQKVLPGWLPWRIFHGLSGMPEGHFVVVDSSGTNEPPTRYEFGNGKRVRLIYDSSL